MSDLVSGPAIHRYRTAVHEAAHIVVGRILGLGCGAIALCEDGTRIGFAEIDPPWLGWRRGDGSLAAGCEAFIVACQAGAVAEVVMLGDTDGGDWADRDAIAEAYRHFRLRGRSSFGDDIEQAHEQRLRRRCFKLVERHAGAIARTAHALTERRRLSAGEVAGLMEGG